MNQENIPTKHNPTNQISSSLDLSFVLSLIGGMLITLGSAVGMGLGVIGRPFFWRMMGYYSYPYMMGENSTYYNYGHFYYGIMYGLEAIGIITGVLVIVFALLMRSRPASRKTYGALILAFSIVSFAGMGGFFIGAILGLLGGVLALLNT